MPEFSKFSFESTTTACAPFCEENSIVKTVNDNIRVIRVVENVTVLTKSDLRLVLCSNIYMALITVTTVNVNIRE